MGALPASDEMPAREGARSVWMTADREPARSS